MHAGIINRDGKWCCCRQALRERERYQDRLERGSEGGRVQEKKCFAQKEVAGVLHYRIINGYMCVCARVCVFRSLGPDEVFLSVRGNQPEQRSSNDGYHRTNRSSDAFCFSHTYFASLSLIHLSLSFFFSSLSLSPLTLSPSSPNTAAHKQKQITDLMKLS